MVRVGMRHCWLEPGLLWRSGIKKLPLDGDTYIGEDLLSSIWAHETTLEHHQPIPSKYHELVGTFKLHIAMAAPIWDRNAFLMCIRTATHSVVLQRQKKDHVANYDLQQQTVQQHQASSTICHSMIQELPGSRAIFQILPL